MTTTSEPPTGTHRTSTNLDSACASVPAEIARTDSKASLLLAFDGVALAGLAGLADKKLPLPAQIVGGAAALLLIAAAVLLLLVVRPDLGGRRRTVHEGFPLWAQLDEEALLAAMSRDTRLPRTQALSQIAVRKYRRLTRAIDTILAALGLLLIAAALAAFA
ncbi:Pycsar system effector family protein [Streptomyces sp. NPDC059788]|uniref:Pycsar system effector family protein n=1 Tax=Streptomyces sp. NPDC059788 TaxID=3346948 RepID=UPI00365E738E